ncbi:hypothetical protein Q5741_16940 [Paenibacillus sp. JX-17]|uniref:Uncharacterized protein n=1 Tax=Paenibacillus lacisoli TaxID=3064525 RepID=A0ABT9CKA1_9BACL|nr:hypothetical protein [Paenibacillus sp. JX-17]MDO7908096.1 hypothetical protein [Paenibacillus sp. JX-17]
MAKQIQAYFKTEDQAEGARTSLQAYRTEHLEVGKLDSAIGRDRRLIIPLVPYNNSGSMNTAGAVGFTGAAGAGSYANNVVPVVAENDRDISREDAPNSDAPPSDDNLLGAGEVDPDDYNDLTYVLSAKVSDEDYEAIVQKLRQNNAYVESFD